MFIVLTQNIKIFGSHTNRLTTTKKQYIQSNYGNLWTRASALATTRAKNDSLLELDVVTGKTMSMIVYLLSPKRKDPNKCLTWDIVSIAIGLALFAPNLSTFSK